MRLNRVLLLAATVNILIFALVLTISCSGDNGPRGKAGTEGCRVEENSDGNFNVICTEDGDDTTVGVLYKGGTPGAQGAPGAPGDNCWLGPLTANGYEILCGTGAGTSKGYMSGCSAKRDPRNVNNDDEVAITCGKTSVNLCKGVAYDPKQQLCNGNTLRSITYVPGYCGKNKVEYDQTKQYCGYAKGDDPLEVTEGTTVYDICGEVEQLKPYLYSWEDDLYCRYTTKINAVLAGESANDFCNGERYNENSWKAQYCGYASATTSTKTVLSGACDLPNTELSDSPQGPNEVAFAQGYCEIRLDKNGSGNPKPSVRTIYSEDLCGTATNNKPNNGSWKNEYCGYASATSTEPTKVYTGLCADGNGPNKEKFNDGYCTIKWEDRLKDPKEVSFLSSDFCAEDETKRPNDGSWKDEYCGFGEDSKAADQVLTGVCDDGDAPNSDRYTKTEYCGVTFENKAKTVKTDFACDNGDKINEGSWKAEYCGYAAKKATGAKTVKQTGACDDGQGPNSEDFNVGYCTVPYEKRPTAAKPAFETEYSTEFCGGNKLNENTWKKEYCGMSKKDADDNDKVYKDMCDDGGKPYQGVYPAESYCQWPTELATGTVLSSTYCGEKNNVKFNENKWNGQYCFKGDNKAASCPAGLSPIQIMKSTDDGRCASPNIMASCQRELKIASNDADFKTAYFNKKCGYIIYATASNLSGYGQVTINNTLVPASVQPLVWGRGMSGGNTMGPKAACYRQNGQDSVSWDEPAVGGGSPGAANGTTVYRAAKPDIDFYVDCAYEKVGDYNDKGESEGTPLNPTTCAKLFQVKTDSKGIPLAGVWINKGNDVANPKPETGLCLARNTYDNCVKGGFWVFTSTKTTNGVKTTTVEEVKKYKTLTTDASTIVAKADNARPIVAFGRDGQTYGRCEWTPSIPAPKVAITAKPTAAKTASKNLSKKFGK